jgi:hypothetical protein
MNKNLCPTLAPGIVVERYETPPTFEPQLFKANRLTSLNELVKDFTFFTPAIIYCLCRQLQYKHIDPLSFFLTHPAIQKNVYRTTPLPGKLFDGFTGAWQFWEKTLYFVPTQLWSKCLSVMERNGVFNEATKQVLIFTFDTVKCPDVIATVKGKSEADITVWAIQGHACDYSIVLHNDGINPLPVLDKVKPDPYVQVFADALFRGDDPNIALKKAKEEENNQEETKEILGDHNIKTWEDLTPAAQRKVTKLIKEYHTITKQTLDYMTQLSQVDSDVKT